MSFSKVSARGKRGTESFGASLLVATPGGPPSRYEVSLTSLPGARIEVWAPRRSAGQRATMA